MTWSSPSLEESMFFQQQLSSAWFYFEKSTERNTAYLAESTLMLISRLPSGTSTSDSSQNIYFPSWRDLTLPRVLCHYEQGRKSQRSQSGSYDIPPSSTILVGSLKSAPSLRWTQFPIEDAHVVWMPVDVCSTRKRHSTASDGRLKF